MGSTAMSKRIENWETELFHWSWKAQRTPFAWGKFDCALMAASAVQVVTGKHPCPQLVGAYHDAEGALNSVRAYYGTTNFSDAAEMILGNPCDPMDIISGSVAYVQLSGRKLFAVRIGTQWLAPAQHGAIFIEPIRLLKTWRIG